MSPYFLFQMRNFCERELDESRAKFLFFVLSGLLLVKHDISMWIACVMIFAVLKLLGLQW